MRNHKLDSQELIAREVLRFAVAKSAERHLVEAKLKKPNNQEYRFASLGEWEWSKRLQMSLDGQPLPFCENLKKHCLKNIQETQEEIYLMAEDSSELNAKLEKQKENFADTFSENYLAKSMP